MLFIADPCCFFYHLLFILYLWVARETRNSCKMYSFAWFFYARFRSTCSLKICRSSDLGESHHHSSTNNRTSAEKAQAVHHFPSQSTYPGVQQRWRQKLPRDIDCENGSFTKYWSCCRFPGVAGILNTHVESVSLVVLGLCKERITVYGVTRAFELGNTSGSSQVHVDAICRRTRTGGSSWRGERAGARRASRLLGVSDAQVVNLCFTLLVPKLYTFM